MPSKLKRVVILLEPDVFNEYQTMCKDLSISMSGQGEKLIVGFINRRVVTPKLSFRSRVINLFRQ